jgi:hypothetical protein
LAIAEYNLAETPRMIEIARAARDHFNVLFPSYGGQFEEFLGREPVYPFGPVFRLTSERGNRPPTRRR